MSIYQNAAQFFDQMVAIDRANNYSATFSAAVALNEQILEAKYAISFMVEFEKTFGNSVRFPESPALKMATDNLHSALIAEGIAAVQRPVGSNFSNALKYYNNQIKNIISLHWKAQFSKIDDIVARGESYAAKSMDFDARKKFKNITQKWNSLSSRVLPENETNVHDALKVRSISEWPNAIEALLKQVEEAVRSFEYREKSISNETSNFIDASRRKGGVPLSALTSEILSELKSLPGLDDFLVFSK